MLFLVNVKETNVVLNYEIIFSQSDFGHDEEILEIIETYPKGVDFTYPELKAVYHSWVKFFYTVEEAKRLAKVLKAPMEVVAIDQEGEKIGYIVH